MHTKAKEVLISQTCNNAYKGKKKSADLSDSSSNRWLDGAAIQQDANRVTVVVVVTDIGVSSTATVFGVATFLCDSQCVPYCSAGTASVSLKFSRVTASVTLKFGKCDRCCVP